MTKHFLIVNETSNLDINNLLVDSAKKELDSVNYTYEAINVKTTLELTLAIKMALDLDIYDAFIAISIIDEDEEFLYQEIYKNLTKLALDYTIPIGFCILKKSDKANDDKNIFNKARLAARSSINMLELSEFFMSKLEYYDQDLIDKP